MFFESDDCIFTTSVICPKKYSAVYCTSNTINLRRKCHQKLVPLEPALRSDRELVHSSAGSRNQYTEKKTHEISAQARLKSALNEHVNVLI